MKKLVNSPYFYLGSVVAVFIGTAINPGLGFFLLLSTGVTWAIAMYNDLFITE
jgi:hypothetical protein